MSYIDDIRSISPLSLDDIIRTAKKYVPEGYRSRPWTYPDLNHGTALLNSEEQLCCYLSAYGEMHKSKLRCAISKLPFQNLDSNLEIVDWGCGQGIASVYMIDELRRHQLFGKLRKVTLIEPSKTALDRAKLNVRLSTSEEVHIDAQNCYLPGTEEISDRYAIKSFHTEEQICIHLFSNILDIGTIDLKKLALIISSTGYHHYFVCVGPVNSGNERISSFLRYFNIKDKDMFVDVKQGQFDQHPNGRWYGCMAKGFHIAREEGKPFLIPLSYYPPKQFFAAYRLDAIEETDQDYWKKISAFEVLAPFDIGASIHEDIDPILAVISNIITRGLPTKSSTFVEEEINKVFGFCQLAEEYGTFKYESKDDDSIRNKKELLIKIPVGIARIEKVIIEAIITGHLSPDADRWSVLVKENDIPCSALAFADLRLMFNHLCAMTRDYSSRKFPEVDLHIISPTHSSSPLHLGNRTYKSTKQVAKEKEYDMVIDFSIEETIDAANVQFSEFKAKNKCYFNVRSSDTIYSTRGIYTSDKITYKPVTELADNGNHVGIKEQVEHLEYFLKFLFRKRAFRPGQLPILSRALQNKSVIGLLPTGGGKSLTYQMAAMLQPGITVIIDPLKSLMEDQYEGLISVGIDCCTYINSELDYKERADHEQMMESSKVVFTFMSPERLCIYEFRERLENMRNLNVYFSYGVIDEVHCVSEWGQDFRFSYLHLGRNLYTYVRGKNGPISLFGLTATASFDVLSDVERELSGNGAFVLEPGTIVRYENSNRLELQYKVERIEVEYNEDKFYDPKGYLSNYPKAVNIGDTWSVNKQKAIFLSTYLDKVPVYIRELQTDDSINRIVTRFQERENLEELDGSHLNVDMPDDFYTERDIYNQAGIIFCPHVNSSGVSVSVNSQNLSGICEVGTFSGSSLDGETQGNESMYNMRKFRDNKIPVMVATKAFGMGIDKPNVRFTVNMNYSGSLESYIQEAGRAGRDRKMALSVILMSDYNLVRINNKCPDSRFPLGIIKGKWFRENDLKLILRDYRLSIESRFIDYCTPLSNIVRLKCNTNNTKDENGNTVRQTWLCNDRCSKYRQCQLRYVDKSMRGWLYHKDLEEYLREQNIRIPKENIEYQGADYNTVMYFFDNTFKGEVEEKTKMHEILSKIRIQYFFGNDRKYKPEMYKEAKGFLDVVLNSKPGDEIVSIIPYEEDSYADIAKAIYRMCIIGLIDDFTQDYSTKTFRILSTRKKNGMYYERLKEFLMRYYTEDNAENEVEKASVRKGNNEIHKCLGYLTEFIYDKVAMKRKRAIDEMRNFCLIGIDNTKDWKDINEELKDEIYYYFNSKYAREGYRTDNNEPFSLLDDTDKGKNSSFDILYKYMRVVDSDVMGNSGSPKDNIKHLQGAVRLIRRSDTKTNAALCLLNVYCLFALKAGNNRNMMEQLDQSYIEGYLEFKKDCKDYDKLSSGISKFKELLNSKGRNIASDKDIEHLSELELQTELQEHLQWTENFTKMYKN